MRLSKIGSAGVKLAGAASCGFGAWMSFVLSGDGGGGSFTGPLMATGAGLATSSVILLGQSVSDAIDAFKTPEKE